MDEIIIDDQIPGGDDFIEMLKLMVEEAKKSHTLPANLRTICNSNALKNIVRLKLIDSENPLTTENFFYWKQVHL